MSVFSTGANKLLHLLCHYNDSKNLIRKEYNLLEYRVKEKGRRVRKRKYVATNKVKALRQRIRSTEAEIVRAYQMYALKWADGSSSMSITATHAKENLCIG